MNPGNVYVMLLTRISCCLIVFV